MITLTQGLGHIASYCANWGDNWEVISLAEWEFVREEAKEEKEEKTVEEEVESPEEEVTEAELWFDIIPMYACHMLLGRPCLFDRKVTHMDTLIPILSQKTVRR